MTTSDTAILRGNLTRAFRAGSSSASFGEIAGDDSARVLIEQRLQGVRAQVLSNPRDSSGNAGQVLGAVNVGRHGVGEPLRDEVARGLHFGAPVRAIQRREVHD